MRGAESIFVVREVQHDRLRPTASTPVVPVEIDTCEVLPRRTYEVGEGWVTVDGWDVYCLKAEVPDILPTDTVIYRGIRYEVEGRPAPFRKGGRVKATHIALKGVS